MTNYYTNVTVGVNAYQKTYNFKNANKAMEFFQKVQKIEGVSLTMRETGYIGFNNVSGIGRTILFWIIDDIFNKVVS